MRARVLAEEDRCALCGELVNKSLWLGPDGRPHPLSPVIDEIIPVSRGGSPFERTNCQLTHRICNAKKSNKLQTTVEPSCGFPLSKPW